MTTLIIGAGLVGSQIAKILADEGGRPLVMDQRLQRDVLEKIVDLDRIDLIEGDVLRPLTLSAALLRGKIDAIVHTAAYPLLTLGAQRNPYAAIGHDESGRVGIEWGVYGVPETFLIDRSGRIRHKHVGPISPKDLQETLLPLIAELKR